MRSLGRREDLRSEQLRNPRGCEGAAGQALGAKVVLYLTGKIYPLWDRHTAGSRTASGKDIKNWESEGQNDLRLLRKVC